MSPLERVLEALLLAADVPLQVRRVADLLGAAAEAGEHPGACDPASIEAAMRSLAAGYRDAGRGLALVEVAEGWQLRTAIELAPVVRRLWPERRRSGLSPAAMEVLAVVAYQQPITRAQAEAVRGVDCGGVLRGLLDRGLLRVMGRKDEPGRPMVYGTSPTFLETFSLPSLRDLPPLRDLADLREEEEARARGERE